MRHLGIQLFFIGIVCSLSYVLLNFFFFIEFNWISCNGFTVQNFAATAKDPYQVVRSRLQVRIGDSLSNYWPVILKWISFYFYMLLSWNILAVFRLFSVFRLVMQWSHRLVSWTPSWCGLCLSLEPQPGHCVGSLGKDSLAPNIPLPRSSNRHQQKSRETRQYGCTSTLTEGE